jgi:ketosteroid isomerase-like protein
MNTKNVMNHTFLKTCACIVCACAAIAVFAQQRPEPVSSEEAIKKAVLETNDRMSQASNSMDVDAFFSYIAEGNQSVIIQNGTVFKTRQEAMDAVKRGYMGVTKVNRRFHNPQVTIISPDTALLASEGTVSAILTDGRSMEAHFAVSMVFVRRAGQWKVLQGHYSMPAKM